MAVRNGLFTSESVSAGHPDKLCDRLSDSILDEFLKRDPNARVACEALAADGKIVLAGEFRTANAADFETTRREAPSIVRRVLTEIGYRDSDQDISPSGAEVEVRFNHQSAQIASAVDGGESLGAGDQGLMFGYATRETDALTPLPWTLANELIASATLLTQGAEAPLRADGKSQVTVRYRDGRPAGVQAVVLSWQHSETVSLEEVRSLLRKQVVNRVVPPAMRTEDFRLYLNPAGAWTIGGPKGDTGLTGRKIIVDTYGGSCPHGGGAFSGKDPSKVDRSGAYAARWVAKNVVAAGLADRCTVQVAYAIGVAEPVSISVDLHGTGNASEEAIERAIRQVFDLTPSGIIRDLNLLRPIYSPTSSLGHFGRFRDPAVFRWEAIDRVNSLQEAVR